MTTLSFNETAAVEDMYVFPASFAQQRLWFLDQLEAHTATYTIASIMRLSFAVQPALLEQSLNALIERHEVLRTSFMAIDGQPMQVIAPSLQLPLPCIDLSELPENQREAEALRLATEEALRPFDLSQAPLLRSMLLTLDTEAHLLVLITHHSIFDGWSRGVFFEELAALYQAYAEGKPSPLADLPLQYVDFAIWQQESVRGERLAKHLAYWKQHLAGAPTSLALPTDRPHPLEPTGAGAEYHATLPSQLTEALKELSMREGVTLYMTLVAAFETLLHRYSGQDDIVLGTVTSGRTQAQTEALIGFFVNTLVLRSEVTGELSFRELLGRVREVVLDAYAHEDVPFEYLVKEVQPERTRGQNPLFQVMLTLDPPFHAPAPGWVNAGMSVETKTSKFDLSLELNDGPEGLVCRFEYSTELFEEATIARLVGHWQTLLEGIVADPSQRVAQLPLLTERERHQLLVEWNATQTSYPKKLGVHQLFEQQVERTPNAVALLFEEQQVTYSELNARANQLAHRLQQLGVGPDVCVGLCLNRSPEMIVGLLGILKSGGAYVPLDPAYPKERLAFMLADTQAPVLLTQEQHLDVLPAEGRHVLCLEKEWQSISQEPRENLASGAAGEHLAYIMYTSGSTGKPKGVEIRHQSISRLVFGVDYARLDATRTLMHMATISFDASTFELWGALLHGARCVLFPEPIPTPKSIGDAVRKHSVTTVWLTASLFNALLDDGAEELRGIEQLLTGGEALSVTHIRRALERLPGTQLINGYGPTESTTFACCYPIAQPLSEQTRSIPIGRPIGNTQTYVLDRRLNPVPIGVGGELYIGGDGLARGYHNRPELTAEKFIAHPWSSEPDARLYKTGDLVRYLADGTIEFLGRLDQQVKLRGFRIELGEIEAVLGQHPAVQEVLVLVRQDERAEKYLGAYIVPKQTEHFTLQDLRHFLKERLPEYMLPSEYVQLDAMPLTPNGKVDHRALPRPQRDKRSVQDSYVAPVLTVHKQLVEIWQDVLNVHPIGITDNFFALGGHSLLAARMVARIEQVCGSKLPLSTLYAGASIDYLAQVLLRESQASTTAQQDSRARVVVVQAGGAKRPFFFLHGDWYGGGFYCLNLARGLEAEQPFYALEPYEFDRAGTPPSFEEMATAHLEAMRAVQPQGPYLLGGFCNGGLVAYEMARQLRAQGQSIELLVLIDPATPSSHHVVRQIFNVVGGLLHLDEGQQLNWFLRYLYVRIPAYRDKVQRSLMEQPELRGRVGQATPTKLNRVFPSLKALRYQWSGIYRWVSSGYRPGSYEGKLTFFWADKSLANSGAWREVSGAEEAEDMVFAGTHMSSKNENLPIVAQRLQRCLTKAQATSSDKQANS